MDNLFLPGLGSDLHLFRLRSLARIFAHPAPPQDLQLPAGTEGRHVADGAGSDDGDDAAGRAATQRLDGDDDHQDDAEEPDGLAVRHLLPRLLPHRLHPLRHDLHVRSLRLKPALTSAILPKRPKLPEVPRRPDFGGK